MSEQVLPFEKGHYLCVVDRVQYMRSRRGGDLLIVEALVAVSTPALAPGTRRAWVCNLDTFGAASAVDFAEKLFPEKRRKRGYSTAFVLGAIKDAAGRLIGATARPKRLINGPKGVDGEITIVTWWTPDSKITSDSEVSALLNDYKLGVEGAVEVLGDLLQERVRSSSLAIRGAMSRQLWR